MNNRGWVIYRHPQSGRWFARAEALAIVEISGPDTSRPELARAELSS
jgi:hypothetical protein